MFRQVAKAAIATLVWKQYKSIIVSTILLFAYLWIVGVVHSDYLSWAGTQQKDVGIGTSFVIKWVARILGVACYLGYHWRRTRYRDIDKNKNARSLPSSIDTKDTSDDPFNTLRNKEHLRSHADILIEKNATRANSE